MGVDHFDIALGIEKTFGIRLGRDEFTFLYGTVADLDWFIRESLHGRRPPAPDFQAAYDMLHRWLVKQDRAPWHSSLFSYGRLNKIIRPESRQQAWIELSAMLGATLPALVESRDSSHAEFPHGCGTLQEIIVYLARHYPTSLPAGRHPPRAEQSTQVGPQWTEESVSESLRQILVYALQVKPHEVVPEARLVEDLGMG